MLVVALRHWPGDDERQFNEVTEAAPDSFARNNPFRIVC